MVMKEMQQIIGEITRLTSNIEANYPELYRFLDENPVTIPSSRYPNTDLGAMKEYLDSLKQLLLHHLETHKKTNGTL